MFRALRRSRQALSKEEVEDILSRGTSGVLAIVGDDDYPYTLPMSYVYSNDKIYFHSAKKGHKIDAINKNQKASFCVIDQDRVVPNEYTTYFRSVIVFGKIKIMDDEKEKRNAIKKLAYKYYPEDSEENRQKAIEKEYRLTCMLELSIEHMSGKEAIELVRQKKDR